jgi:hypothetical protein
LKNIELTQIKEILNEGKLILARLSKGWTLLCTIKTPNPQVFLSSPVLDTKEKTVLISSDSELNRCFKEVSSIAWDLFDTADGKLELNLPNGSTLFKNYLDSDGSLTVRKVVEKEELALLRSSGQLLISIPLRKELKSLVNPPDKELADLGNLVEYQLNLHAFSEIPISEFAKIKLGTNGEVEIIRHAN